MMKKYLIKVFSMNEEIEKKLAVYGDLEVVSKLLKIYLIRTAHNNYQKLLDTDGVISVKEEDTVELMPLSAVV